MKLPRDWGGEELAHRLRRHGYEITRQTGSHMRLSTSKRGEHHITIPQHKPLRVGTLSAALRDVADHRGLERDDFIKSLLE